MSRTTARRSGGAGGSRLTLTGVTTQVAGLSWTLSADPLPGAAIAGTVLAFGSLASIAQLQAIRREGEDVGFGQFLKVGTVTMVRRWSPRWVCG